VPGHGDGTLRPGRSWSFSGGRFSGRVLVCRQAMDESICPKNRGRARCRVIAGWTCPEMTRSDRMPTSPNFSSRRWRGPGPGDHCPTGVSGQRLCFTSRAAAVIHAAIAVFFGSQGVRSRIIASTIVNSLRDTAVHATFKALPACF